MSEPFIGEIKMTGINFAQRGWAFCDGQLLPIAQNTALFSLLGTTYGGDGRTSFALPGLRGRAPMHPGNGPGLTQRRLGEKSGAETTTLVLSQMPNHDHDMRVRNANADNADPSGRSHGASPGGRGSIGKFDNDDNTVQMHANALAEAGGSQAHDNMQPFLAVNFVIALVGLFPSRS